MPFEVWTCIEIKTGPIVNRLPESDFESEAEGVTE